MNIKDKGITGDKLQLPSLLFIDVVDLLVHLVALLSPLRVAVHDETQEQEEESGHTSGDNSDDITGGRTGGNFGSHGFNTEQMKTIV